MRHGEAHHITPMGFELPWLGYGFASNITLSKLYYVITCRAGRFARLLLLREIFTGSLPIYMTGRANLLDLQFCNALFFCKSQAFILAF